MQSKSTTENTKVYKSFHGIIAETSTAELGEGWKITTMKRSSGKLTSNAQKVTFLTDGNITFSFGDKNITLISRTARATEKTIKEQHAEALILFDSNEEIKAEKIKEVYEIKTGQRVFLDGYGKNQFSGNEIIYAIENTDFGTNYLTVDTVTLELGVKSYIKDFAEKFGIGTYYIKGDLFKGTQDELNNFVIEAKQKEVKENEREESAKLLSKQIEAGKIEAGKEAVNIPSWAKSVIVAELYEDNSDIQSDYFATGVENFVILGFSSNTRNNISELKKFALNFEETKDFAIGGEDLEHTQGHSQLPNYFLGSSSWSGWKVSKDKYNYNLENEAGKNKIYKAFAEGRYFVKDEIETKPESVEEKAEITVSGNFEIVDYSEKALALFGDTKSIKEELKAIGGRFNARLKYEDTTKCGWIFSKTKRTDLEKLIG